MTKQINAKWTEQDPDTGVIDGDRKIQEVAEGMWGRNFTTKKAHGMTNKHKKHMTQ